MGTRKNTVIESNGKKYQYYRITRTIGYKFVDGKKTPIKKQFTGSSKKEAESKYKRFLLDHSEPNKTSLGELMVIYTEIFSVNSKYAESTRELYITAYNNYLKNSNIRDIEVSSLQLSDMQQLYNSLDVSYHALQNIHKYLVGFFRWCEANGYCKNIISGIVLPDKPVIRKQDGIVLWSDDEIRNIIESDPDYIHHDLLVFATYTGMRISELLGLRWEDIDENIIHVKRQYCRGVWSGPKYKEVREIPIHEKIKGLENFNVTNTGLVFKSKLGNPLDYHTTMKSLRRYYKRIGVEYKKFHAYRATFCTKMCKNGVPIQVASKLMGHRNINVTAKYYTSIEYEEKYNAICKL